MALPKQKRSDGAPRQSALDLIISRGLGLLWPHLKRVKLKHGEVLAQSHREIQQVYFPHSGIVSFVLELADGNVVQTGMVGRDGVVGAIQALDHRVSLNNIVVHVPGEASVVGSNPIREAAHTSRSFRLLLVTHEQFFVANVQQSVACNALHSIEQRMCRWLLRMNDLVGTDIPLTQELLAAMIGVRRTSVSLAAASLQNAGLIKYKHGHVAIIDIDRLMQLSCECYLAVRQHYDRLFGSSFVRASSS